jgi:hypothetical protein
MRGAYRGLAGKPEGRRPFRHLGLDGRTIWEWILKKISLEGVEWIILARVKEKWWNLLNTLMKFHLL